MFVVKKTREKKISFLRDFLSPSGSGKDDYYSSSTQKQSIETITTSRNTSVKQLGKLHVDNNFTKSPSIIEMAAASSRFANINENDLSKMVRGGSEINVFSDGYIQEIQLNFYPPSALYSASHHQCHNTATEKSSRCKYCGSCNITTSGGGGGGEEENCLSIDVIQEATNSIGGGSKSGNSSGYGGMNDSDGEESQKKAATSQPGGGNFSHIAFKRSDSILHISIGNSSKVMKRRKKHRWIFTKLYKLSKKKSSSGSNSSEAKKSSSRDSFSSPETTKDGKIFHLNNMSGLNMINDNIVISINRKARSTKHNNEICQNQFRSILTGDMVHGGANELDLYMNELKMREMG